MRQGRLSKREVSQLRRAEDTLNAWIDYQEDRGINSDNDYEVNRACLAVVALVDFLESYGEE